MRYLLPALLLSFSAQATDIGSLINDIEKRQISLEMIATLVALDQPGARLGYGLCTASGEQLCKQDMSVGHALCEISGEMLCKKNSSIGYGLCRMADGANCKEKGSIGYGICHLGGGKFCK
ncbi:MAG: hypothetical protein Cons2KO_18130 [Congregibacter sp.]